MLCQQQSDMLITRLDGAATTFRDTSGQPQLFEPFPLVCSYREGHDDDCERKVIGC
jgi:hypothetical protein